MNKIYIIVLDGAADRPIDRLGKKTPLEKACTPNLDKLASKGKQTMITVIDDKICPESDSGSMALLSYDPMKYYTGRGPLEGLGTGFLDNSKSSIAFRVNFASFDNINNKLDRRTSRDLEDNELQILADAICKEVDLSDFGDVTFKLLAFGHHRGILCFSGNGLQLSGLVSNTDPGFKNVGPFGVPVLNYTPIPLKCTPLIDDEGAQNTANIVNAFVERSHKVLKEHPINLKRVNENRLPANLLLVRDGGENPQSLPSFFQKYGCKVALYGQIPAECGLAKLIGGEFFYSKAGKSQSESEFLKELEIKVNKKETDVVFVHLKGPDEPGHDNRPEEKVKAIELIDKNFFAPLISHIDENDIVVVTCDHATPCELGIHSTDKVPILVSGSIIGHDGANRFAERFALNGGLHMEKAIELIPLLVNYRKDGMYEI